MYGLIVCFNFGTAGMDWKLHVPRGVVLVFGKKSHVIAAAIDAGVDADAPAESRG